jgi:predicted metal-dependent peptidase
VTESTTPKATTAHYSEQLQAILADPIKSEITHCKVKFLMENPFIGQIASRLDSIEAPWCRTGATDGRHLYWNREFMKSLNRDQMLFFIAHEVYHIIFDHVGRRGHRDPEIWNMAVDFNINFSLKQGKIGEPPSRDGKEIILYDERYTDDMSAYEIYDLLIENSTTIEMPLDEHLDIGGEEDEDSDSDKDDDGDQEEGKGDGKDGDKEGGEGNGKTVKVRVLGKDGPPKLSKKEIEKLRQEIRANIISAAQQAGADSIPLGLRKMINALVEPKLDWRSLLDAYIRSSVKDDYSFQNISRRSWGCSGAILPGQKFTERVEVFCAIDASGSTTQEMVTDFLSEVTGIVMSFPDYKIDLVSFDTEVYNHKVITPDNVDDLYQYEIKGNGGTMFECIYEYMKREGIEPERLVFLTDGLPNSGWGDPNYSDTIFIIHSNAHIIAPFGLTAHYERKSPKGKK